MQGTPTEGIRPADRAAREIGAELLMRLEALLKTMRLYDPEHPRRRSALQELEAAAGKALACRGGIGILARKDALTVYVGESFHTIQTPLGNELLKRSTRYLQILPGAGSSEFEALATILAMKPEAVKTAGGAPALLRARGLAHMNGLEFRCQEGGRAIGEFSPDEIRSIVDRILAHPMLEAKGPDAKRIEALRQLLTEGEISAELATLYTLFMTLYENEEKGAQRIDLFELLIQEVAGLQFPWDSVLDEGMRHVLERLLGMLKGKVLERMFGGTKGATKRRPIADDVRESGGVLPLFLGRAGLSELVAEAGGGREAQEPQAAAPDGAAQAGAPAPIGLSLAEVDRFAKCAVEGKARPAPTTLIRPEEIPEHVRSILGPEQGMGLEPVDVIEGSLAVADELKRGGGVSDRWLVRSLSEFIGKLDEPLRLSSLDAILASSVLDEGDEGSGEAARIGDLLAHAFDPRAVVEWILERGAENPARCRSRLRQLLRGANAEFFFELASRLASIQNPGLAKVLRESLGEFAEKGLLPEIERSARAAAPPKLRELYAVLSSLPSPGCRRIVADAARTAPPEKRVAALRAIAASGGATELAPLLEATEDKDPAVRYLAISLLATRPDGSAVRRLCEIAEAEKLFGGNLEDRLLAVDALARQGSFAGLEVLREISQKRRLLPAIGRRKVRRRAREALSRAQGAKGKKGGEARTGATT